MLTEAGLAPLEMGQYFNEYVFCEIFVSYIARPAALFYLIFILYNLFFIIIKWIAVI